MNELDALRSYAIQINVKYLELERDYQETKKMVFILKELVRTTMEAAYMNIQENLQDQDWALKIRDELNNIMDFI